MLIINSATESSLSIQDKSQNKVLGKKVLHVIDALGVGGAERLVVEVICGLPEFEHHLIILKGAETLRSELPQNCQFTNLQARNREIFKQIKAVKRYLEKCHIDLVHAHLFFSSVITRLATPKKIPLLNSIHNIVSQDLYIKNRLALYLERLTYRKQHHIVAVSQAALNDFDEWIGIKGSHTVLYNFIRDEFFHVLAKPKRKFEGLRLVAVGNLRYQKNYPYLIAAFKRMPKNVSLDIYGSGDMQRELQEEINEYNLPIRLMGSQKDLVEVLPSYDAFVMSSFFEGQPLSLLEAIACGLPAILSDIPVLREVTKENALYFDLKDPEDLANKIVKVLAGEIDIMKNVVPAYENIASFARKEIYLQRIGSLYKQALKAVNGSAVS